MSYFVVVWWFFFFFKQKTAYEMRISDWSSDVCSSDLIEIADRTHVGAGDELGVGLQRRSDLARTRCRRFPAFRCLRGATAFEFGIADLETCNAIRNVDDDLIDVLDQCAVAAFRRFRRNVTDRQEIGRAHV